MRVRTVFLQAMAAEGLSLGDLRRRRRHRRGNSLIPTAMLEHCIQGYKNIAIDAALGKPEAYGPFLRMMADAHTILQPAKDEVAGARERVPKPAIFIASPTAPSTEESPQPAARPTAPDTLLGPDGTEYVA